MLVNPHRDLCNVVLVLIPMVANFHNRLAYASRNFQILSKLLLY